VCQSSLDLGNVLGSKLENVVVFGKVRAVPAALAVDLGRPALGDSGGAIGVKDSKALNTVLVGLVGRHPLDVGPHNGLRGFLGDWSKGARVEGVGKDWTGHLVRLGVVLMSEVVVRWTESGARRCIGSGSTEQRSLSVWSEDWSWQRWRI